MDDVECSYCGYEQQVINDDGHGTEPGVIYEEIRYHLEQYGYHEEGEYRVVVCPARGAVQ